MDLDSIKLEFNKLTDYPTAAEEICLEVLDHDHLVAICGFNTGAPTGLYSAKTFYKNKFHQYSKAIGKRSKKYWRGFRNTAYLYCISKNQWTNLPKFPGSPRQGVRSVRMDDGLYFWGGFSYQPAPISINKLPQDKWQNKKGFYAHFDGYRLCWNSEMTEFKWQRLPNLPIPLSNFCILRIDHLIYIYCGGSHHPNPQKNNGKLDVLLIDGEQLGQKIWTLNTKQLENGWQIICHHFPGTPRLNASSCLSHDQKELYLIGGSHPNAKWTYQTRSKVVRYYCVTDNWKYNLQQEKWIQITSTPISSGNWASNQYNLVEGRYLWLLGGGFYPMVMNCLKISAAVRHPLLVQGTKKGEILKDEFKMNNILIYDLIENRFYERNDLKMFNYTNLPSYVILEKMIYFLGGEQVPSVIDQQFYGLHPDLFMKAQIKTIQSN